MCRNVLRLSAAMAMLFICAAVAAQTPVGVEKSFPSSPLPTGVNPPTSGWGSPWSSIVQTPSVAPGPVMQMTPPQPSNSGIVTVVACGFDNFGVWRVVPLSVAYKFNGVSYSTTVVNAWNQETDTWSYKVDMPAYNTIYYQNGTTYRFYAPLSTGTYYFNL